MGKFGRLLWEQRVASSNHLEGLMRGVEFNSPKKNASAFDSARGANCLLVRSGLHWTLVFVHQRCSLKRH